MSWLRARELIADAVALKAYGLGMVRPGGYGLKPFLADGYLTLGATLRELAQKLGIDADNLERTVAVMNGCAKTGIDPEFARGSTPYHRAGWGLPRIKRPRSAKDRGLD